MKKWPSVRPGQTLHVYPLHGKDHVFCNELTCWCMPKRDMNQPQVIVHRDLN